ncbi:MAG: hypothetical protein WAK19_17145 [Candidatus Cybelea sp.]
MNTISPSHYALSVCTATAILAGCGGSQPPIGAPNVPQRAGSAAQFGGPSPNVARSHAWRAAIAQAPVPGEGCYTAAYPLTIWKKVTCVTAPNRAYIPRSGAGGSLTVGDENDYAAVTSTLTSNAVGSFPKVRHLTSEKDRGKASVYSPQLNSNFMSGDQACAGAFIPGQCRGWLQFVYSAKAALMQYWLINYAGSTVRCPAGWRHAYGVDCWRNSSAVSTPQAPVTDLPQMNLSGNAVNGGLDTLVYTDGTNAYSTTGQDSVVYLSQGWTASEFNIFGDGGGTKAQFNSGAALTVEIDVTDGTTNAPTCQANDGTTGETNNLNLKKCTARGGAVPRVKFHESRRK